jgi:hypothetical protein
MFVLLCLFVHQPRKAEVETPMVENTEEVKKEVEENTIENTEEVENTIENTIEEVENTTEVEILNTLETHFADAEILWQGVLNTLETVDTSEIFQNTIEALRLEIVHCQNITRENTEEVENTIEEVENTEEVENHTIENTEEVENTIEEVENTIEMGTPEFPLLVPMCTARQSFPLHCCQSFPCYRMGSPEFPPAARTTAPALVVSRRPKVAYKAPGCYPKIEDQAPTPPTFNEVDYGSESESDWEWENTAGEHWSESEWEVKKEQEDSNADEEENNADEVENKADEVENNSSWCRGGLHPPLNWWTGIEAWNAWAN